jgi:hypothetical protein
VPFYRENVNRPADDYLHEDQEQRTCRRIRTAWTKDTSGTRIPEKGHRRIKEKREGRKTRRN